MAEIPINYLKYIDQDGTEKKVYPITVTDAVYDSDGNKLSNVLLGVLKDTDISNVQSDSTTTVPSSALLKATDDKIGDTSSLPGESSNVVSAITQLNSDLTPIKTGLSTVVPISPESGWSSNGNFSYAKIADLIFINGSIRDGTSTVDTIIASGLPQGYFGVQANPCYQSIGGIIALRENGELYIASALSGEDLRINLIAFKIS